MANVHRIGFTELTARGDAGSKPCLVNIVFVHGLRGHPRHTWEDDRVVTEKSAATAGIRKTLRSLFRSKSSTTDPQAQPGVDDPVASRLKVFWPEEFLAHDLRDARVWTYGYNADVIGGLFVANNQNSISQHGRGLANRVEQDIDNENPIVFVAHSLGGIIVKDAINRSKICRVRTKLIVFLGTPHRGSQAAGWGEIAANLVRLTLIDANKKILESLEVNGEVLDNIHEDFKSVIHEGGIMIYSFQEARGITGVKGLHGKVVDDYSSKLDLPKSQEVVDNLDANHMQMARCRDRSDPQYRFIFRVLERFMRSQARDKSGSRSREVLPAVSHGVEAGLVAQLNGTASEPLRVSETPTPISEQLPVLRYKITEYFESLSSMNIAQHLHSVEDAQGETFQWVRTHDCFTSATDARQPAILHITGKPGCGKSVLSKLLYKTIESAGPWVPLYFAFSATDAGRRKPLHILASFISQLSSASLLSIPVIRTLCEGSTSLQVNAGKWNETNVQGILGILHDAIHSCPSKVRLMLLIDALDECVADEDRAKMLRTLGNLVSTSHADRSGIAVIVTSRPYSDINFQTTRKITLDLNSEKCVDGDLEAYIADGVGRLLISRPAFTAYQARIVTKLQQRADKMYLLIELLLRMMELHSDSSRISIENLLDSLPSDLSTIFDEIWSRISDADGPRAKMFLSWILCAFRPFTVQEFGLAIARYGYDNAMREKLKRVKQLDRAGKPLGRWDPDNPLDSTNLVEFYEPIDVEGDISRMFGPLLIIEPDIQYGDAPNHRLWSRIKLCHLSVRDHFLLRPGFIQEGRVHAQMAILCARQMDGTITGDPAVLPREDDDFDADTISDPFTGPYTLFWSRHVEMATDTDEEEAKAMRLWRKPWRSPLTAYSVLDDSDELLK